MPVAIFAVIPKKAKSPGNSWLPCGPANENATRMLVPLSITLVAGTGVPLTVNDAGSNCVLGSASVKHNPDELQAFGATSGGEMAAGNAGVVPILRISVVNVTVEPAVEAAPLQVIVARKSGE